MLNIFIQDTVLCSVQTCTSLNHENICITSREKRHCQQNPLLYDFYLFLNSKLCRNYYNSQCSIHFVSRVHCSVPFWSPQHVHVLSTGCKALMQLPALIPKAEQENTHHGSGRRDLVSFWDFGLIFNHIQVTEPSPLLVSHTSLYLWGFYWKIM